MRDYRPGEGPVFDALNIRRYEIMSRTGYKIDSRTIRADFGAGTVGALLALPQAIALALLAGMPVEYGFYTSILPVMIAALAGSSWQAVAGPNTAICVVIASSMVVFAPLFSEAFVAYVMLLTLIVGLMQLVVGVARLGTILDFISQTVVNAVILAVAVYLLVSSLAGALGIPGHADATLYERLHFFWLEIRQFSPAALVVSAATVIAGLVMRRFRRAYSVVAALVSGVAAGVLLQQYALLDAATLKTLGSVPLSLTPFAMPDITLLDVQTAAHLFITATVIAFLGLMQSVVIARSLERRSGQLVDTNREIVGQGLANLVAPFVSAFAGSGSFNRSATNFDSGARTPLAAVFASLILLLIAALAAEWLAYIPNAAVAGILILVGLGLINPAEIRHAFKTTTEASVFVGTVAISVGIGLTAGVLAGVGLSLVIYLAAAARPSITLRDSTAMDGRRVTFLTIGGSLFFGSVRTVEKIIADIAARHPDPHYLVIETDYLTYLDSAGLDLLEAEIGRHHLHNNGIFILVDRPEVETVLHHSPLLQAESATIIHRDRDHPMKPVLYPGGNLERLTYWHGKRKTSDDVEETPLKTLANRLATSRQLGPLSREQLESLLADSGEHNATGGDILFTEDEAFSDFLVLLDGTLEAQRTWISEDGGRKSYTWNLEAGSESSDIGMIAPAARCLRLRALTPVRYLLIDADRLDMLSGWAEHFAELWSQDDDLRQRMETVRDVGLFLQMAPDSVALAFKRMREKGFNAGGAVVKEGDPGDSYYIIQTGEAEVWRSDPFSGETRLVATLGPGDAFGEEALLQDGFRNATITMSTPGTLLVLDKTDFNELVRPSLVEEISAEDTRSIVDDGRAALIDCRYEMEFEECRIPGADLIPLDQIRAQAHRLDPDKDYIVYCRSGRRSKAAAFLLKERNLSAKSMAGGIKGWPFAVEPGSG